MQSQRAENNVRPLVIFDAPHGSVKFNPEGLSPEEQASLQQAALAVFTEVRQSGDYILRRCNWFVDTGYPFLKQLVQTSSQLSNPRIMGCDYNPFDQHYWLEVDIVSDRTPLRAAIIDPIFGYVGLKEKATSGNSYYRHEQSRIVPPGAPRDKGGVRINTIGI